MRRRSPPAGPTRWALSLALCVGHLPAAVGFVLHLETDCPLSPDGTVLWANWTLAFNKVPMLCYAEEFGEFLPCFLGAYEPWYSALLDVAAALEQLYPNHERDMREACQEQTRALWGQTGLRQTPPKVQVFPVSPQNTAAPVLLSCVAWGFYPAAVRLSWLKNGHPVGAEVGEAELSSNGDWTYQARLTLPVEPRQGDRYSCRVAHDSLPEPITRDWAPGLPLQLRAIVGAAVAVLGAGLAVLLTGVVCWKRRVAPEGYLPIQGGSYPEGTT